MQSPFDEVKELVRAKRYADARDLLSSMEDEPKAQKWLQRLDEIMLAREDAAAASAPSSSTAAADEPAKKKMPFGEPRNPSPGADTPLGSIFSTLSFMMPMIILPLWSVYLAFNWKRMGKPQWTALAVTSSLAILVGMWTCFVLALTNPRFGAGFIVFLIMMFVAIWLFAVQFGLQSTAYKKWKDQGAAALYKHQYPVYGAMFRWAAGFGLLIGGVVAFNAYQNRPRTFTSPDLSVVYESAWTAVDLKTFPECASAPLANNRSCVAAFQKSYGSTGVLVFKEPNTANLSLKDADLGLWMALGQQTPLTLQSQWATTIDGLPARGREFTLKQQGLEMYAMSIILLKDTTVYWVFATSTSKPLFEDDREAIKKLYTSLNFLP